MILPCKNIRSQILHSGKMDPPKMREIPGIEHAGLRVSVSMPEQSGPCPYREPALGERDWGASLGDKF
jgi:hypothetical protein